MKFTIDPEELVRHFTALAVIDGVSLDERRIADHITSFVKSHGGRVIEDGAAAVVNGNTGNLICFPPGHDASKPSIALCAHLDTVQPTKGLRPVVTAERITSSGDTILGGDDREGLAVITYLLKHLHELGTPVRNFIMVFTVAEELGMYGANAVDLTPYNVTEAYIFDCSKRPGIYIKDSPGCLLFTAEFHGKASHAGVAPEEGLSAIGLAARAIASVRFGRIDAETTSNIGTIAGGSATNVVADRCTVQGEIRSFTQERIDREYRLVQEAFRAALNGEGSVTFTQAMDFHPYILSPDSAVVRTAEAAIAGAGLTPNGIRYTGGSDANSYNAKGVPAVNLGTGAQKPHSHEEFVLIQDLITSTEIAREIITR